MGKTSSPKRLDSGVIEGRSKIKRQTRAIFGATIASQKKAYVLRSQSEDGKTSYIHAVIMGDDRDDGKFAESLAHAYNLVQEFVTGPGMEKGISEQVNQVLEENERLRAEIEELKAQIAPAPTEGGAG